MAGNVLTAVVVLMMGGVLAAPVSTPQQSAMEPQAKEVLGKIAVPRASALFSVCPRAARRASSRILPEEASSWSISSRPTPQKSWQCGKRPRPAGLLGKRVFADRGSWRTSTSPTTFAGLIWPIARRATNRCRRRSAAGVCTRGQRTLRPERKSSKPFPPRADAWSHPYHGPDKQPAVPGSSRAGALYLTQFLAEPDVLAPCRGYGPAGRRQGLQGVRFAAPRTRIKNARAEHAAMASTVTTAAILWRRPCCAAASCSTATQ